MTKLEKMAKQLNDTYTAALRGSFEKKFQIELETSYGFISGSYISTRLDGEDFTAEQATWLAAYEEGYLGCLNQVRIAAA